MAYNKDIDYEYTDVDDPSVVKETIIQPSNLEDIDTALHDYVKSLNIHVSSNKGRKEVPVVWVSAERSFQMKNNPDLRDGNDVFILPSIMVERTNITKDLTRKGGVYGNIAQPGDGTQGRITVARRIVQDKTQDNANAVAKRLYNQSTYKYKNNTVVYETITVPVPVYVNIEYEVSLRAEYIQQINEMSTPFLNSGLGINYVALHRNGHTYELFLQDTYSANNNVASLAQEERKYETKLNLRVLGYIIGNDKNNNKPRIEKRQNFVTVKTGRERVIVGDLPEIVVDGRLTDYRD